MAPVQQTFSVIPELPSAFANGSDTASARSSKPPMTTKQAKKLYKAATKAPKLSKAEQRKQDLMEQDRIRREFEKERNQARAKTARDKKKEKEEKEKADKKRKGLPLKEVHPSQDTLARFMRPLKPAKKVEEDPKPPPPSPPPLPQTAPDDMGDETLPGEDESRPVKRQKLEEPVEQAIDDTTYDQSPSRSPEVKAQEKAAPEIPNMEAEKRSPVASPSICAAGNTKIEDQAGECHANGSFSADDDLDDDDFSALFVDVTLDPEPGLTKPPESRHSPLFSRPPDPLGPLEPAHRPEELVHPPADAREPIISRTSIGSSSQHLGDVSPHETQKANRDTRDKHPPGLAKATDLGNKNSTPQNTSRSHISSCPTLTTDSKATNPDLLTNVLSNTKRLLSAGTSSRQAPVVRREPTHVPQTIKQPMGTLPHAKPANPATIQKMAPPPLPPRIHSSRSESVGLAGSRIKFPPTAAHTTPAATREKHTPIRNETTDEYTLPSSTQLFLLNNMDDLFPSPSQEVQEIFEKPRCIRNRTLSRHQPLPPPRLTPSTTGTKVQNPPVTPQIPTARQSTRRMPPPSKTMPTVSPLKPKHNDVSRVPLQSNDKCNMSDGDFPFLSTQDIFMSSQDIRELEEDTSSPIKPLKPLGPSACNQPTRETLPPNHNSTKASIDGSKGQVTGSGVAPDSKTPKLCGQMALGVQNQPPPSLKAPMSSSSQSSSLPDTPTLPRRNTRTPQSRFIHPRVAPRSSANGMTPDEQRSSSSNPFRFKAPTHGTQRPSQGFQNAKTAPAVEPTGASHSQGRETPRPSPKPFFTSSGTRELTFLAIERSKRSAREDLHARRRAEEDLAKQNKSKRLKETPQKEPKDFDVGKPPRPDDEIDDDNDYELDEILLASDLIEEPVSDNKTEPHATNTAKCEVGQTRVQCPSKPVGVIPALIRPRSPDEKKSELVAQSKPKGSYEKMLELAARQKDAHDQGGKRIESMSEESDKENREQDIPMASQGTDYGDAAWDMTDLDLDSFL